MKITALRVFARADASPPWIFVKVYTDAGVEGLGEATSFPGGEIIVAALHEYGRLLVGRDPREIERQLQSMRRHTSYLGNDGACAAAQSGIEIALWDIVGQVHQAPIHQLLGGKCRDRVPLYANGWIGQAAFEPAAFAERAARERERGFRAVKLDPFSDPQCQVSAMDFPADRSLAPERHDRGLAIAAATHAAMGADGQVAFDVHGRFNVPTAIAVGRELAAFRPLFYEEPTEPDNFSAMRKVARALAGDLPICSGERYYGCKGFQRYIEEDVLDIIMPDVCRTGGILEMRKIAAHAETHNILLAPHNPNGPVGTAASLHVMAVCANGSILEYFDDRQELRARLGEEVLGIRGGEAAVPSGPGLGIRLPDAVLEEFVSAPPPRDDADTVFKYSRARV
jgi:galactonate dehydratase